MNNGVQMVQASLLTPPPPEPPKYRVFENNGRFQVGRKVFGSVTYDVVEDCRTRSFAEARCDALNAGRVKA